MVGNQGQVEISARRVDELLEISHHSLIQYRLPTTGEIVPLLQIVPSKTDEERLLVVSRSWQTFCRPSSVESVTPTRPFVPVYDRYECVWRPPSPVLFQRRFPSEIRAISDCPLRTMLNSALVHTGLKDLADEQPLHYSPHDFRKIFITDAVMSGLPPHIAQVIAGYRDINVTMGYKAVYPDEAIQAHLAFLARRRALRPGEVYRVPTNEEWDEFLGHFERHKVALGECGRTYGTDCPHEHACLRCPQLHINPKMLPRLDELEAGLEQRRKRAVSAGWLGEIERIDRTLQCLRDKRADALRLTRITRQVVARRSR